MKTLKDIQEHIKEIGPELYFRQRNRHLDVVKLSTEICQRWQMEEEAEELSNDIPLDDLMGWVNDKRKMIEGWILDELSYQERVN